MIQRPILKDIRDFLSLGIVSGFIISYPSIGVAQNYPQISGQPLLLTQQTEPRPIHYYVRAQETFADNKEDVAIDLLKKGLKTNPEPGMKSLMKLSLFIIHQKTGFVNAGARLPKMDKKAIYHLTEAIKLKPNDFLLYAARGNAYCGLDMLKECMENHSISMQLNPDKGDALHRRAHAYTIFQDFKAAAKVLREAADYFRSIGAHERAKVADEGAAVYESGY